MRRTFAITGANLNIPSTMFAELLIKGKTMVDEMLEEEE